METKGASFSDLQQEIARIQFQHRSAMARVEEQEKQGDRVEITPASQICNRRSLEFNFSIDLPWHQLKNRRSRKIGWRGRFFQNVTVPLTERFHSSMAFYADEDDVWRCADHPSRRRNIGVCPACLREKLAALCPECASLRPCNCCSTNSASSSSSSSSLSFISFPGDAAFSNSACGGSVGSVGRVSSLIDSEQSYRRSRSVAVPFFKSARFSSAGEFDDLREISAAVEKSKPSFWLYFWPQRSKREKIQGDEADYLDLRTITRSKSVAAPTAFSGAVEESRSAKSKGWYFPSPMKVFRHSKASAKIVQERSPLHRGY